MSTKDNLENMAKNTWLAGLGSIDSSKETLGKSIDAAQEKSNSLFNDLVSRGEVIQGKINEKKDELQARGKAFFGIGATKSQDEKIAKLNAKVDQLTTTVVALIEKRNAEKTKPATRTKAAAKPKAAAKAKTTTTKATATKATASKTTAKPKAATQPKTAAKSKTVAKPKAAPKAKTATKATDTDAKKAD